MKNRFYSELTYWKKFNPMFPDNMKIDDRDPPEEFYLPWNENRIHIDSRTPSEYKGTIIFVHGVASNGRILSHASRFLADLGYRVLSPDLPGYGLSEISSSTEINYPLWLSCINHVVDWASKQNEKPIFLFGLSLGGIVSYDVAALNPKIRGIIVTTLISLSDPEVRLYGFKNKWIAKYGAFGLSFLKNFLRIKKIKIKNFAKVNLISNNQEFSKVFMRDPFSGGNAVYISFLQSIFSIKPALEPERFKIPILLAHPSKDLWTPTHLSLKLFDRIPSTKYFVELENCGHAPLEEPGIQTLQTAIQDFLVRYT